MKIRLSEKNAASARRFIDGAATVLRLASGLVPGVGGGVIQALGDVLEAVSDALEDDSDGGRKITRDEAADFARVFVDALEARGVVQP